MAPAFWWSTSSAKDTHRGTPVVVKMENPNWSMVELEGPSDEDFLISAADSPSGGGRVRNKNAKQFTWVLLLKAHRAAGCLTSLGSAMLGLSSAIRRRVASGRTDTDTDIDIDPARRGSDNLAVKGRFYFCIKMFLWMSVVLLGFEVAAYLKGWHFGAPDLLQLEEYLWASPAMGVRGMFDWVYTKWVLIRVGYLAPPLQFLASSCIVLFMVQSLDRLILCLGCFWIRFKKIKPVPKEGAFDPESGETGYFPMVLVQIPMCNEKEVTFSAHWLNFVN